MNNLYKYLLGAAIVLPVSAIAQSHHIDFEKEGEGYTALGVYDSWERSPFRPDPATGRPRLEGNVKVIKNHLKATDKTLGDINSSGHILAFQRSRFASNVFGARIDLAEPLVLTTATQYVHVKVFTPTEGRVMLVGLGKRRERADQSKEVEQFNVLSITSVKPGKWYDAVFPVKGMDLIDVYSLVVVPNLEPTHDLKADFAAFIDDIEVNNSSQPRIQYDSYPVSFNKEERLNRTDRYTSNVKLTTADGVQTISVGQQSDKLVWQDALDKQLKIKAGTSVTPNIGFVGTWMNGYVYLDRGNDGKFSYDINDDGTPKGSDLMSYSNYDPTGGDNGRNSLGQTVNGNTMQTPDFTVPADLKPGFYRMRFKVDWNEIDPAGSIKTGNLIAANGGVVVDTRLNVHADAVRLSRGQNAEGTNGEVLNEDGTPLATSIPFGKPYTIRLKPAPGFEASKIIIRHGYNLSGDSLVHDTPQYEDVVVSASKFKDNVYTIPAEYIDGDVRITPFFPQEGTVEIEDDYYPRNFDDKLEVTRTDRRLNSFSFTGTKTTAAQQVTVPAEGKNYVYRNLTAQYAKAFIPGETLITAVDYTGHAMHLYLYIDFDQDGQFSYSLNEDGTPAPMSELAAYTYYNKHNSKGESIPSAPGQVAVNAIPSFTLPDTLKAGVYRARLKVDWDNTDPAGHWSEVGTNQINENGGQIVDFLMNIGPRENPLAIVSENGAVVGAGNSGVAATVAQGQAIQLQAVAAADGYDLEGIKVRHGRNLDGKQYVKGNRQWEEYSVSDKDFSIDAAKVDGEVRITATFAPREGAAYKLRFAEEFDQASSQPDPKAWTRCTRSAATWSRFIAQTPQGQAETAFVKDGLLTMRCLKNTIAEEQAEMVSGAIESRAKVQFTYGKVEARMKTTGHAGNFPAFWLMPADPKKYDIKNGEIDIYEAIDDIPTSYHTVHTYWGNTLGNSQNPPKGGTALAPQGLWHTFGVEWTPTEIKWSVNGKVVFSYAKLDTPEAKKNLQWVFDKDFYIILNQSVGDGSWAKDADRDFTYETQVDWVRVYQKDGQNGTFTGIVSAQRENDGLKWRILPGVLKLTAANPTMAHIVDLQGMSIFRQLVSGSHSLSLQKGVYVLNGNKIMIF